MSSLYFGLDLFCHFEALVQELGGVTVHSHSCPILPGGEVVYLTQESSPEMRYCEISKAMSSLYFGLDVFCQCEARVPEFDAVFRVQCKLYTGGVACQILGL